MRYKDVVLKSLDKLTNQLNIVRHQSNTGDRVSFNHSLEVPQSEVVFLSILHKQMHPTSQQR